MRLEPAAHPFGQQVGDEETRVVPGGGVAGPGIAEADDKMSVVGHGRALERESYSAAPASEESPPAAPSSPASDCGASSTMPSSAADSATSASRSSAVGAWVMIRMTVSGSTMSDEPAGSWTSLAVT